MNPNQIILQIDGEKINEPIEIIRISKEGFYYKGEMVDDIHNVYERFNDWLKLAEKKPIIN
jgi:hypothetical protein